MFPESETFVNVEANCISISTQKNSLLQLTNNTYGLWKWRLGNRYSEIEDAQITFKGISAKKPSALMLFFELQIDNNANDDSQECSPDLIEIVHNQHKKPIYSWNAHKGEIASFKLDAKSLSTKSEILIVASATEEVEVATQYHPSLSPVLTITYQNLKRDTNDLIKLKPRLTCGDYQVDQGEQCDSSFGCSSSCECIYPLFEPFNGTCIPNAQTTVEILSSSGDKSFPQTIAKSAGLYLIAYGGGTNCFRGFFNATTRRCKC